MSRRYKVLAALVAATCLAVGTTAYAIHSAQEAHQLAQSLEQNKDALTKAIQAAERQVRNGQVISASLTYDEQPGSAQRSGQMGQGSQQQSGQPDQPGQPQGMAGQPGQQGKNVVAHVYVVTDTGQLRLVKVDAKSGNVTDTQDVQRLSSPYAQEGMDTMRPGMRSTTPGADVDVERRGTVTPGTGDSMQRGNTPGVGGTDRSTSPGAGGTGAGQDRSGVGGSQQRGTSGAGSTGGSQDRGY